MDKGGKRLKKKKMNFERNYCNKVHRKETEQNTNRPCLKERRDDNRTTKPDPGPLLSRITLQHEEQNKSRNKVMNRIGGVENGRNLSKRLNLHRSLQRPKCL